MVRFVNLEKHGLEQAPHQNSSNAATTTYADNRPDAGFSLKLSLVLSCYPIISQLVQYVDHNTLHELSRTCRRFRANLLQHRELLMQQTLRCVNEETSPASRLGDALNASVDQWRTFGTSNAKSDRISGGRVSTCARDMVGQCRRCGEIVCRNCVMKSPSVRELKNRHRRLCRTCMKCPISRLDALPLTEGSDSENTESKCNRGFCMCEQEGVYICKPCGQMLSSANTTYLRGWSWRARYSACGGVGAGLGEGNEGVECGRDGGCLAARPIQNEIECDADDLAAIEAEMEKTEAGGRQWAGNSYMTHEIVGLGGKVKKKIVKKVLVGASVKEYEDERLTGKFLRREQESANRSWCGWCLRIVPGKKDAEQASGSTDSIASTTSSNDAIASA